MAHEKLLPLTTLQWYIKQKKNQNTNNVRYPSAGAVLAPSTRAHRIFDEMIIISHDYLQESTQKKYQEFFDDTLWQIGSNRSLEIVALNILEISQPNFQVTNPIFSLSLFFSSSNSIIPCESIVCRVYARVRFCVCVVRSSLISITFSLSPYSLDQEKGITTYNASEYGVHFS